MNVVVLLLLIVVVIPVLLVMLHYVYELSKSLLRDKKYNRSFKKIISKSGLIIVPFFVDNEQYNFFIDTGASKSVIDKSFASKFNLKEAKGYSMYGFTGESKKLEMANVTLRYVDHYFNNNFIVSDLTGLKNKIMKKSGIEIVGAIGNDILTDNSINIDFNDKRIYL
jgi:predicted aspartyl protease